MGEGLGRPQLPAPSIQGVSNDTSSLETERGLRSCPSAAAAWRPQIDRISGRGHKCMPRRSVDGEVEPGR